MAEMDQRRRQAKCPGFGDQGRRPGWNVLSVKGDRTWTRSKVGGSSPDCFIAYSEKNI